MRILKNTLVMLVTSVAISHMAQADSSSIHKAAAERLQTKLGSIRGTIKPAAQNVFLTEFRIEQLKPIVVGSDDERAALHSYGVDERTVTHSVEQEEDVFTVAGQGDLDELTAAVDKMIAAQE